MIDRLTIDQKKLNNICAAIKNVRKLKDPIDVTLGKWKRPNNLLIKRVSIPLGVIGVIFESRPNVASDISSLCFKSGNAVILKGGSEALNSNKILVSFVIGYFTRTVGFIWLAVLVVGSEFSIVLSRFIFEYEQAFQGDLVRFWYSALYLFASAYALMHEGHVRVDVLYTGFTERKKAWTNSMGSLVLGIPLCLIVIFLGMGSKASIINGPVLSFEITQQGSNGLYLLYLMAIYLAVFAVSMLIQFTSYFMSSSHKLLKN